jgi:hypothetical protein
MAAFLFDIFKLFRLTFTCGPEQRRLFRADDRVILRFFVYIEPVHVLLRDRHVGEDCLDRALRQTGVAIDTGVGVDEKLIGQFVESLDGANGRAVGIFTFDARLGNNIGHSVRSPTFCGGNSFLLPEFSLSIKTKACSSRYSKRSKNQSKTLIPESLTCQMRFDKW